MIQGIEDVERFVVFCVNHERLLQVFDITDIISLLVKNSQTLYC